MENNVNNIYPGSTAILLVGPECLFQRNMRCFGKFLGLVDLVKQILEVLPITICLVDFLETSLSFVLFPLCNQV